MTKKVMGKIKTVAGKTRNEQLPLPSPTNPENSESSAPVFPRVFPLDKNPKCRVVRVLDLTDTLQFFRQKDGYTKLVSSVLH